DRYRRAIRRRRAECPTAERPQLREARARQCPPGPARRRRTVEIASSDPPHQPFRQIRVGEIGGKARTPGYFLMNAAPTANKAATRPPPTELTRTTSFLTNISPSRYLRQVR